MITNKRILTIQDISCVGQCSLTVAQPIISACGVEACILPSAVLSTHTGGFHGFTFRDLTEDMPKIEAHWNAEGIFFDAVYSGYLGSTDQIDIVKGIMESTLLPGGLKIVDPAMADHGRLYYGFDDAFVRRMAELCGCADIILPNLTEACFMTGIPFDEARKDEGYVLRILHALAGLGAPVIVLKGISLESGQLGNAVYDAAKDQVRYYFTEEVPKRSHGTGDCFASAFTGALMQGMSVYDASALAADFVVECLLQTMDDEDHWYGVKFEKALPMLVSRLNRPVPKSGRAQEAAAGRVRYVIDGSAFSDREGFYSQVCALMTAGDVPVGHNLDAFNDILRGGFGKHAYGEPIEIIWEDFEDSREALGEAFLLRVVSIILNCDDDHDCVLKIGE